MLIGSDSLEFGIFHSAQHTPGASYTNPPRNMTYFVVGLYDEYRSHAGLKGETLLSPNHQARVLNHIVGSNIAVGLYETPMAA